ncbi:hypothetical protein [Pseudomarimonas salicorniae]|uniref:STAS/SEC14 domain-containing protein n=1 Tax=Pseudomarimonas salicorniae TaxID=2933270 RepID=A0ABT0GJA5_9GAMM|nr:hypothetical protein [Lysobacter sp. CAU 1642]MCK7594639.1 hypothetical protein [Lysobacter sp. CAU 1642]
MIEIAREGRVLRVVGGGPTNSEGIQHYIEALKPWLAQLGPGPWATLGIVHAGGSLLTPEAEALFRERAPALAARGRVAMALCSPPHPGNRILHAQWRRIYGDSGSELGIFERETDARAWLIERLSAHGAVARDLPSPEPPE